MLLYLLHYVSLWERRLLRQADKTQPAFPRHIGPSGGAISFAEDEGQEHHFWLGEVSGADFLYVSLSQNGLMTLVVSPPPPWILDLSPCEV